MKDRLNALTNEILGAAVTVHRIIGPGARESTYEACLTFELIDRGPRVERRKGLPLLYRGRTLDCGLRIGLRVEGLVGERSRPSNRFEPVRIARAISYLKLSGRRAGLLINFNTRWRVDHGIKRIVNGFPD